MTHQKARLRARDWRISVEDIAGIGAGLALGARHFKFYSPSLQYAVYFCAAQGTAGAQLGASLNLGSEAEAALEAAGNAADRVRSGNDNWRLFSRFSANDMDGATFGVGSVGADVGIAGGSGEKLVLFNRRGNAVAEYQGGSFGLALGLKINIGSGGMGVLFFPHWEWTGHGGERVHHRRS